MTLESPFISIIIPCYNEQKNLEHGVLNEVLHYVQAQTFTWEVIIVNDASTDASRQLVADFVAGRPGFTLYDIPHGGKPAAVWEGIQRARGEIVLFTDMDQSTPLAELDKLLPWYDQGYDVVIGSRGMTREGFSILRKAGSVAFRLLRQIFLLRGISDTQCGFKSCRREAALKAFPFLEFFKQVARPTGWKVTAYDVELLHLWEKAGYQIKEVTVDWRNRDLSDTKGGQNESGRYIRESLDMGKQVARVSLNELRGEYKGILRRNE